MFLHGPSSTLPLQYSWNMTVTQGGNKLPFNTCKMYINLAEDVPVPIESNLKKTILPSFCLGGLVVYRIDKFQVYTCILFPGAEEDQLFSLPCHIQGVHKGV